MRAESDSPRVFVMRMVIGGKKNVLPEGIASGTLIIGWAKVPELMTLEPHAARRALLEQTYGRAPSTAGTHANEIHRFLNEMNVGDLVLVAAKDSGKYHAAEVIGDAAYHEEFRTSDTAYRRPARWLNHGRPYSRSAATPAIRQALKQRGMTCRRLDEPYSVVKSLLGA